MNMIKAKDYKDMSRKAANIISAQVIMKPDCVLGLATGSSPVGTYEQLVKWYEQGDLDFPETMSRAIIILCIIICLTMSISIRTVRFYRMA